MHILVVNDDGPPSTTSSPYVLDLVWQLRARGHVVSVVLPDTQRSWISKAHIVGQTIKPTYYRPATQPATWQLGSSTTTTTTGSMPKDLNYVNKGSVHPRPFSTLLTTATHGQNQDQAQEQDQWILVNSTPATCVQIGLYHHPNVSRHGAFDLVISGPNYGRNTTAVFALSSGTLGGALEAAVCNVRAIALSYAFFERNHDPVVVRDATVAAVNVIEGLVGRWSADDQLFDAGSAGSSQAGKRTRVQLFSVNVPLKEGVRNAKAVWTRMLLNTWSSGSCFEKVEAVEEDGPEAEEENNRAREVAVEKLNASGNEVEKEEPQPSLSVRDDDTEEKQPRHCHYKWAPRFGDVYKSVRDAPPGNDGWAVEHGLISVTPLLANFMQIEGLEGDVDR